MQVRFWGTRGSLAKPGPTTARFGGNTSCVEIVTNDGTLIVIDCGTGAHGLGQLLMARAKGPVRGHLLISHTHWDHIQGLPFFAPLFVPGNEWNIYGPRGLAGGLREALSGQMQHTYFPIALDDFGAVIHYHDLVEGNFVIDDVVVHTHYLNHPALTLGYRVEADGGSVAYCCDHEPFTPEAAMGEGPLTGADEQHVQFVRQAGVVIHDTQYTVEEYPEKVGWGHSPVEYAVRVCADADVATLVLTHHDPLRDDAAVAEIEDMAQRLARDLGSSLKVVAAAEGMALEVEARGDRPVGGTNEQDSARSAFEPGMTRSRVLFNGDDADLIAALTTATSAEHLSLQVIADPATFLVAASADTTALVIAQHDPPRLDAPALFDRLPASVAREAQVAIPTGSAGKPEACDPGINWLTPPFSESYVRSRFHAWILRTAPRWQRGARPDDEEARVAALHALSILDTEPEERFDRITRIAAAALNVPVALVSLVDSDRQWFKSCMGIEAQETHRDLAFCSHVVASRQAMVVPDTLLDERFADHPMVLDPPRVRFYAGAPLVLSGGECIGTLCAIDTRARQITRNELLVLSDLRDLVMREIEDSAPSA